MNPHFAARMRSSDARVACADRSRAAPAAAHEALPGDGFIPDERQRQIVDRISTIVRWTRWSRGNELGLRKIACCAEMDWSRFSSTLDMLYFAGYCMDRPGER